MHQDSTVYTDAKAFKPERFLAEDGATPVAYPDTRDLGHHTFGFGRRYGATRNFLDSLL